MKKNRTRVLFLIVIIFFSNNYCFSQKNDPISDKFLIVLDIQEYYTSNQLSEDDSKNFIDSINNVINKFNPKNVIYVKTIHLVLNLTTSYPYLYISLDVLAMRLDSRMKLVNEHTLMKEESSAFSLKALNKFLKQNNAKEIVMIGLMAEECLYESVLAGKELGYDMYVLPEAIIGKSKESKDKVLQELINEGIKILNIHTLKNE